IMGSLSSSSSMNNEVTKIMNSSNGSTINVHANEMYTTQFDYFDESSGADGNQITESLPTINPYDRSESEYAISDWADNILKTAPNINEFDSKFYDIPNNEYLKVLDYHLSTIQDSFKGTINSFDYSFNVKTVIGDSATESFSVNGQLPSSRNMPTMWNGLTAQPTIEIVSIPTKNDRNTDDNNILVDQFEPYNSDYVDLSLGEAYVVSSKWETFDIESGDEIELYFSNPDTTSADKRLELDLNVKDIGKSPKNMYLTTQMSNWVEAQVIPDSLHDTDTVFIYVSEETMFQIIQALYFDLSTNTWDPLVYNNSQENSSSLINYNFSISTNWLQDKFDEGYDFIDTNNTSNPIYNESNNILSTKFISDEIAKAISGTNYNDDHYTDDKVTSSSHLGSEWRNGSDGFYYLGQYDSDSDGISNHYAVEIQQPRWSSNFNYIALADNINSYESSSLLFILAFVILGAIITFMTISKTFRKNSKEFGVLKSMGYSQLGISLSITAKAIIYIFAGILISLIFLPIIMTVWSNVMLTSLSIPISKFYLPLSTVVLGWFVPLASFSLFAFLVVRFAFLSRTSLDLIKDAKENKPNKVVGYATKVTNGYSFHNSYAVKNSLRKYTKSFSIMSSISAFVFFILAAFATSGIVDNTVDYGMNSFSTNAYGAFNNSNFDRRVKESYYKSYSNEEFESGVEDGSITSYTFGLDEMYVTGETYYDALRNSGDWWTGTEAKPPVRPGGSTTPATPGKDDDFKEIWESMIFNYVSVEKISNSYISNDTYTKMITVINHGNDLIKFNSVAADYFEETELFFNSLNYDSYLELNPDSIGIALGMNVQDRSVQHSFWLGTDITLYENETGKIIQGIFSQAGGIDYWSDAMNLDNANEKEIKKWNDLSTKNDGKVYFYLRSGSEALYETVSNALGRDITKGDSFTITVPKEWMTDTNGDGILTNTLSEVDLVFNGYILSPYPGGIMLNTSDPDWYSFDSTKNDIPYKIEYGNYANVYTSELTSFNEIDYDFDNYNDQVLGQSYVGNPVAMSSTFNMDTDLTSVGPGSTSENAKYFYNSSSSLTLEYIINEAPVDETSVVPSYLWSDSKTLDQAVDFFNGALWKTTVKPLLIKSGIDENLIDSIVNKIIAIDSNVNMSQGGLGAGVPYVMKSLMQPEAQSYQDLVIIFSIFAIVSVVLLVVISIQDIVYDNSKFTNLFKTLGFSSAKTTYMTYIGYFLIFGLGLLIGWLLFLLFGSILSASAGTIITLFPLVFSASQWQIWFAAGMVLLLFILSFLIAYIKTSNSKPITKDV
ncbi:MAG: ABC transporter permease, partial [Mycoplasmataceae bacterium]|nr:ABC transporter permease [Mycoplasmataceae bacterium]